MREAVIELPCGKLDKCSREAESLVEATRA